MMERIGEILEAAKPLMEERFIDTCNQLQEMFKKDKDSLIKSIQTAFRKLFELGAAMQQKGEKGAVKYIVISWLHSGLLTGDLTLRLDLYDQNFYCDETETSVLWQPEFLTALHEKNMADIEAALKRQIIRIRHYEIEAIEREYVKYEWALLQKLIEDRLPDLLDLMENSGLRQSDDIMILYGGYMDTAEILWQKGME